jgi:hypothetical protein
MRRKTLQPRAPNGRFTRDWIVSDTEDAMPGWMIALLWLSALIAGGYMAYGFLAWQTGACT